MRALILLLFISFPAFGQVVLTNRFETLTVGSMVYSNCTVKAYNAAEAIISFQGGGAKVAISNLPVEIQTALKFNSSEAAKLIESQRQAEINRQNALLEQQRQKAILAQQAAEAAKLKAEEEKRLMEERRANTVIIKKQREPNPLQRVGAY